MISQTATLPFLPKWIAGPAASPRGLSSASAGFSSPRDAVLLPREKQTLRTSGIFSWTPPKDISRREKKRSVSYKMSIQLTKNHWRSAYVCTKKTNYIWIYRNIRLIAAGTAPGCSSGKWQKRQREPSKHLPPRCDTLTEWAFTRPKRTEQRGNSYWKQACTILRV